MAPTILMVIPLRRSAEFGPIQIRHRHLVLYREIKLATAQKFGHTLRLLQQDRL